MMRHVFDHPLNGCCACGEDFTALKYFDRHHVGMHEYTYSEGLRMDPAREDGRRCLSADEMGAIGLALDEKGRWTDPVAAGAVRAHFRDAHPRFPERQGADVGAQPGPVPVLERIGVGETPESVAGEAA